VRQQSKIATKTRQAVGLPWLIIAGLAGILFLPDIQSNTRLLWSCWSACAVLLVWWLAVVAGAARKGRDLRYRFSLVRTHYVQGFVLTCIFAYWGWYWEPVYSHAPLIVAQLLFAFLFEALLSWSRGRDAVLGFGPVPIVLSMNLFLWFRDEWFFLQFLLVAAGFLGKEFITWTKNDHRVHIFNPSAIALSVFAAGLIVTGSTDLTWGREIAVAQFRPEHIYLEIFLLGLIVQALFSTTLVTVTAAAALWLLSSVYLAITGVYFFGDSTIPIAIFLGLHFLITDPATSPQTRLGRALFGTFYGVAAFVLFGILERLGQPTFYDKLLAVPILNLSTQLLDRFARSSTVERMMVAVTGRYRAACQSNAVHMGVWVAMFAAMLFTGEVGQEHRGKQVDFWEQACADERKNACRSLISMQTHYCGEDKAAACNYLGEAFLRGRFVDIDPLRAMNYFERACALGTAAACVSRQSVQYQRLEYVAELTSACDQDDAQSCALLGYAYYRGSGVPRDEQRAVSLVGKACTLGFAAACNLDTEAIPEAQ